MTIWERPIRTYIETALKHISPEDSCALFLICFDAVDMPDGSCPAAEAVEEQGRFLSALFRATDIIGRNDTGEWAVFICDSLGGSGGDPKSGNDPGKSGGTGLAGLCRLPA